MEYCLWKTLLKNCVQHAKLDNGKASLTTKNVNDHLDALNLDVLDNRNIYWNCLTNSRLHLSSTRYDDPPTGFVVTQTTMKTFLITNLSLIKIKLRVNDIIIVSPLRVVSQAII